MLKSNLEEEKTWDPI